MEMYQSTGQCRYQKKCGIILSTDTVLRVSIRVPTSGKFTHTFAKSGNQDETAPQDFHCLLSQFIVLFQ